MDHEMESGVHMGLYRKCTGLPFRKIVETETLGPIVRGAPYCQQNILLAVRSRFPV